MVKETRSEVHFFLEMVSHVLLELLLLRVVVC